MPHGLFHQITLLKEKHPHLKFIISVGGWTDSGPFYEMAATEENRQTFARSCAEFLKTYPQFDGIDIDWEHPVAGGLQPGQPRDAHNYVLLLAALRSAIGPGKFLTVAVGAGARAIDPLEYADMASSLDWVNVMTYDFPSGGRRAGFNSALYNHDDPSNPRSNTDAAVQAILAKGVPRTKLVVGVPFYGRGWRGIESEKGWTEGPARCRSAATGHRHESAAVGRVCASLGRRGQGAVVTTPRRREWIIRGRAVMRSKDRLVEQGLGGAMFWELSNDDGTLPLKRAVRDVGWRLCSPVDLSVVLYPSPPAKPTTSTRRHSPQTARSTSTPRSVGPFRTSGTGSRRGGVGR